MIVLALMGCGPSMADLKTADPCYSATVYVDTLTAQVDSVGWQWTPGVCDG